MPAADATAPDLALPALDVRSLARRAALPIAVVGAGATALALAGGPLQAFASALERAFHADPRWVVAAAGFELLSFAGYIALLWLVAGRATPRMALGASAEITLGGAAATRLLPAGGVGGVALTVWAFRRAGLGARDATRTLLAFLVVLYSIFLGSIVVAGGMLAIGLARGGGPLALSAVPAVAAALAIVAALVLAARLPASDEPVAVAPVGAGRAARARTGLRNAPGALGAAVRDAIAIVRSGDVRLLGALAWWGLDVAVLWAMLQALGAPPSLAVVVLGYFVGQVANTMPIPGAVSSGIVGVLLAFGVEPDLALASVLGYRAVAIWLPVPIGLAALGRLRRTVARWSQEDATATQAPATAPARTGDREREGDVNLAVMLAGRFVGIVRAVAPFLAGASDMRLRAFVPWSLIGTAAWATTFTLIGFAFNESFSSAADTLTHGALALATLAAGALAWRAQVARSAAKNAASSRPISPAASS